MVFVAFFIRSRYFSQDATILLPRSELSQLYVDLIAIIMNNGGCSPIPRYRVDSKWLVYCMKNLQQEN